MELTIETNVGVGPIKFGMSRAETRSLFQTVPETFRRSDEDASDVDEYADLGIYIEFDANDHCIAVEMFDPADPVFQEKHLLRIPFASVREWVERVDPALEKDEAGIYSNLLGIGVSADIPKRDKKSLAESVIAFVSGYYEG
jgi:hypothetical protein